MKFIADTSRNYFRKSRRAACAKTFRAAEKGCKFLQILTNSHSGDVIPEKNSYNDGLESFRCQALFRQ